MVQRLAGGESARLDSLVPSVHSGWVIAFFFNLFFRQEF